MLVALEAAQYLHLMLLLSNQYNGMGTANKSLRTYEQELSLIKILSKLAKNVVNN